MAKKKDFSKLTPEQIGVLEGKDLEAYNNWLTAQEEAAGDTSDAEEEEERDDVDGEDESEEDDEEDDEEPVAEPVAKAGKKVTISQQEYSDLVETVRMLKLAVKGAGGVRSVVAKPDGGEFGELPDRDDMTPAQRAHYEDPAHPKRKPLAAMAADRPSLSRKEKAKMTPKQIGKHYFEGHPYVDYDEVYVTSNGEVFPGSERGKNAAANYASGRKSLGEEITVHKVSR